MLLPILAVGAVAGGVLLKRGGSEAPASAPAPTGGATNARAKEVLRGAVPADKGVPAKIAPPTAARSAPAREAPKSKPAGLEIKDAAKSLGADGVAKGIGVGAAAGGALLAIGGATKAVTGSDAAAGVATIFPGAAIAFGAQKGAEQLAKDVFKTNDQLAKDIGMTAGLLVIGGPIAAAKPLAEAGSALIGAVAGEKAEQDVRNAVAQLDPTSSTSAVGSAVASAVGAVSGVFKGLFG